MLHGIDVSTYQGQIDWATAKASGQVDFVYAKATEGLHEVDDQFSRNRVVCKERGIPFGSYHFFHPEEDGELQAQHFLSVAAPVDGELVPMVDVEVDSGLSAEAIIEQLSKFNQHCEALLGRKIIIYTDYGFWNGSVNGSDAFSGHPLWIAEYNHDAEPTLPQGWNSWVIWQHSSSGSVPGVNGDADLDVFNSTAALSSFVIHK